MTQYGKTVPDPGTVLKRERDHKPGSVLDGHLSRPRVTARLKRSRRTRRAAGTPPCILHRVGFTSPACYQAAGELLPRLSILTVPKGGGFFLLHFPWSRLRRPLTGTLALRCPDFPHARRPATVCSPRTSDSICLSVVFVNAGEGKNRLTCPFTGDIISICQRKAKLSSGSAKVLGESRPAACACSSVG